MTLYNDPDHPGIPPLLILLGSCFLLQTSPLTTSTFTQYDYDYNDSNATTGESPGEVIGGQQWGSEIKAAYFCKDEGDAIPAPGGNSTVPRSTGAVQEVRVARSISK